MPINLLLILIFAFGVFTLPAALSKEDSEQGRNAGLYYSK
jgi:hypothetical protein